MSETQRDAPTKIGDQTFKAMMSLGGEEIRNLLYPSSNVAQHSVEPGMYGDRTYGDVVADRTGESGRQPSLLDEKLSQAETARNGRGHEPQSPCQE